MSHGTIDTYNIIAGDGDVKGHCMHGRNDNHIYTCHWNGSSLQFWVDYTNVGSLSDRRLKNDIKQVNKDILKAIEEIKIKQFKLKNRNGKISFGIIAQELNNILKKYSINIDELEIIDKTQYTTDNDKLYYIVNYEQLSILKIACLERSNLELRKELKRQRKDIDEIKNSFINKEEKNGKRNKSCNE